MAKKFYNQGIIQKSELTHPEKYIGKTPLRWMSAWEKAVFNVLDNHPNILQWSSESIEISYQHPGGYTTTYYPDLFIIKEVDGIKTSDLIEIKPLKESGIEHAKTKYDKDVIKVNMAKWTAAEEWCRKRGHTFKILTENDLFAQSGKDYSK